MKTRARERFQQILGGGLRPLGAFVMSNDPSTSAIFASAGYDSVVIDREHGMIDLSAAVGHVRAVEVGGATPFIRVPENAEQAARLVRATRYEFAGRGKCPRTSSYFYNLMGNDFSPRGWTSSRVSLRALQFDFSYGGSSNGAAGIT